MEIVHTSKIQQNIQRVSKLRPLLIAWMVVTILTIIPLAVWVAVTEKRVAYNAHSIAIDAFVLAVAVGSSIYGVAILKKVPTRGFLVKITQFLLMFDFFSVFVLSVSIVYAIIHITAWSFLLGHSLVRVAEFGMVSSAILLLRTKRNHTNKKATSIDTDHSAKNDKEESKTKVGEGITLTQTMMTEESVMGDSAIEYTITREEAQACQSNR